MKWRGLFDEYVLDRGLEYCKNGRVTDIRPSGHGFEALVHADRKYRVGAELSGERVIRLSCSCDYAKTGKPCSHIAAFLYTLEDMGKLADDPDEERSSLPDEVDETYLAMVLEHIDSAQLRDFLLQTMKKDRAVFDDFILCFSPTLSEEEIETYRIRVDRIFSSSQDKWGHINRRQAAELKENMQKFFDRDMHYVIGCREYDAAFDITMHICRLMQEQDLDDTDAVSLAIADECYAAWCEILTENSRENLTARMFQWFVRNMEETRLECFSEKMEEALMENFKDPDYLELKLELANRKIAEFDDENGTWATEYQLSVWVKNKLYLLYELGADEKQINAFLNIYGNLA